MKKTKFLIGIPALSILLTGCGQNAATAKTQNTFVMNKDVTAMSLPDEGKQIWDDADMGSDDTMQPLVYIGHRDLESAQKYYILAKQKVSDNNDLAMIEVNKDAAGAVGGITYISYTLADSTLPNNYMVQKAYDSTEAPATGVTLNDQYDTSVTVDDDTKQLLDKATSGQEGIYTPIETLGENKAGGKIILCYETSSPHANGTKHFCLITIDGDGKMQNKKCIDPDDFDPSVTGINASTAFPTDTPDSSNS